MHKPGGLRDHHLGISAIRMNAREFLVTTVHEIAISTEFAITARASEEADADALTNRPALDARAKGIDPPDHFVPRDARPADWKGGFHRAGIRVADTARLDLNAHFTGTRIDHRFHYGFEFSRFRYLDCSIHCGHIASFYFPQHFRLAQRHLGMKHSQPSWPKLRCPVVMPFPLKQRRGLIEYAHREQPQHGSGQ